MRASALIDLVRTSGGSGPTTTRSGRRRARATVDAGRRCRLLDVEAALSARTPRSRVISCSSSRPVLPESAATAARRALRAPSWPTSRSAAEELGAIYLGGTPVTALAAAGRIRELRPGALAEAATAFRSAVEPWCPEILAGRPGRRQRSLAARARTRPPPAPASVAGPCGEAMPSTRIAFRPRPSRSRPSVEETSSPREVAHALEPVADRVAVGEQPLRGAGDVAVARRGRSRASARGRSRTGRRRRPAARPSPRRSAAARPGPRSWRAAAAGRRRCSRTRARRPPPSSAGRASATLAASSASWPAR